MPAGKVTGTNREVEAVVAASFAARMYALKGSAFASSATRHVGVHQ